MFSLKRMEKMCGHNKSAVRQRESRLNGSNVQLLNMRISIDTLPPGEHRHTQWSSGGEWDICSYQASTHTQPAKHSTEPVCITVIFIQLNSSLKTESGGRGPCQEASPNFAMMTSCTCLSNGFQLLLLLLQLLPEMLGSSNGTLGLRVVELWA